MFMLPFVIAREDFFMSLTLKAFFVFSWMVEDVPAFILVSMNVI